MALPADLKVFGFGQLTISEFAYWATDAIKEMFLQFPVYKSDHNLFLAFQ
jgi:hypothetical protein